MADGSHFIDRAGALRARGFSPLALGDPSSWPPVLAAASRLALASNSPTVMWWGPAGAEVRNDAYGALERARVGSHPLEGAVGKQVEAIMAGRELCGCADHVEIFERDGSAVERIWSFACSALFDAGGVAGVIAVCDDVTEKRAVAAAQKEINAELRREAARARSDADDAEARAGAAARRVADELRGAELRRLRTMFGQAPGFMCLLEGPDHVFEFANEAFSRLVGGRDLRWKSAREALGDLEGQGFFERLDEAYRSGEPFVARDVPLSIQRRAGGPPEPLFVDFVYQPLLDSSGEATGIFVEGFDVTERRAAIAAREASEDRLKRGMLAARMVVWDWDLATNAVVFSDNAVAVLGGDWTDVDAVWSSVHPEDLAKLAARRSIAIASIGTYEEVIRVNRLDNGNLIWLQVRATVVAGADGVAAWIQGVSIDVTERKRAEEALRLADRRKDQFVAMLAHELRNPLAPIVTAAQILKARNAGDAGARKAAEIVARQAAHMAGLIDDVLDVSRFNTGLIVIDRRPLDLRDVLAEAAEQVRPAMEARRHQFVAPPEGAPIMAHGDRKRLVQAVANLLQNAAKFTPHGGRVQLTIDCDGELASISVSDDGVGIEPDLLPHVFEMFRQKERSSERAHGGLGLGLSLVRSLAKLHGGSVLAESAGVGKGCRFTIELPLGGLDPVEVEERRVLVASPAERALDILVVDDHLDAARMLRMVLEEAGHRVQVDADPHSVLGRARVHSFDVFLMDIGLPGMDGNALARAIRGIPGMASATLVAVTGRGKEYGRDDAIAAGFNHYFVKPADPSELLALLAEIAPRRERPAASRD
ncbi:hybrid sensor histidine kinase/response regulator [Massilia violaceinigra]|nr:ATP-binding protein [Massilia violaceinigra]